MSRTRSTTYEDSWQTWHWVYRYNGVQQYDYSYSGQTHKFKTIVDSLTPNYYSKLREGEFLPINTVDIRTYSRYPVSALAGTATYGLGEWSGASYYEDPVIVPLIFSPSDSDIDHAVIQALAKAKSPELDILTFFGELPDTVRMLHGILGNIGKGARKAARHSRRRELRLSKRQRRPYSVKSATDDFTSRWLMYRYGIRPLLYDAQDVYNALFKAAKLGFQRNSYSHTVDLTSQASRQSSTSNATFTHSRSVSGTVKYRAVVFHDSEMSSISANPLVAAWELTRLSFVVDWFVDVGSWIQAMSPRAGYNQLGISVSWHLDWDQHLTTSAVGINGWTWSVTPQQYTVKENRYVRQPYTGSVPVPSIQVNLNPAKVLDLASLGWQILGNVADILSRKRR